MLISTKGRYAMRLAIRIASAQGDRPYALREIAAKEDISFKYLEQLARLLVKAGILRSVRGKGGGYVLARPADEIRAGDVLRAAEGGTTTVNCAGLEAGLYCPREESCKTMGFWAGLNRVVEEYVDGVSLADLVPEEYILETC